MPISRETLVNDYRELIEMNGKDGSASTFLNINIALDRITKEPTQKLGLHIDPSTNAVVANLTDYLDQTENPNNPKFNTKIWIMNNGEEGEETFGFRVSSNSKATTLDELVELEYLPEGDWNFLESMLPFVDYSLEITRSSEQT